MTIGSKCPVCKYQSHCAGCDSRQERIAELERNLFEARQALIREGVERDEALRKLRISERLHECALADYKREEENNLLNANAVSQFLREANEARTELTTLREQLAKAERERDDLRMFIQRCAAGTCEHNPKYGNRIKVNTWCVACSARGLLDATPSGAKEG